MADKFKNGDRVTHTSPFSGKTREGRFIAYGEDIDIALVSFPIYSSEFKPTQSIGPGGFLKVEIFTQGSFIGKTEICGVENLKHTKSQIK